MVPITLWYKKNQDGEYEYNHYQEGHINAEGHELGALFPDPKHENQKKAWSKGVWVCSLAHLSDDNPPKVIL